MADLIINMVWDFLNGITGSIYLSAFILFVLGLLFFLFVFQGDFELALLANLLLVFIIGNTLPWLKIMVMFILGIWTSYRVIDALGQRNG